jgi:hypothetical protein
MGGIEKDEKGDQRKKKTTLPLERLGRADITKAISDPRPESYNIAPDSIELGAIIKAGKTWEERCAWLLNEKTVFPSVEALRVAQESGGNSLGIVKPKIVNRVIIQQRNSKEVEDAIAKKRKTSIFCPSGS